MSDEKTAVSMVDLMTILTGSLRVRSLVLHWVARTGYRMAEKWAVYWVG